MFMGTKSKGLVVEKSLLAPLAVLRIVPGTASAVAYNALYVHGYMRPIRLASILVLYAGSVVMSCNKWIVGHHKIAISRQRMTIWAAPWTRCRQTNKP